MATITASMVKDLRERTSAGMMDCKKALDACAGDIEKAVDWLRKKGLSQAAKKAGRATSEGLVCTLASNDNAHVAMVEVKCETDFVSRGDKFQGYVQSVTKTVFDTDPADIDTLLGIVGEDLNSLIATLGENMSIGRAIRWTAKEPGIIATYVHANGKIGVMVELGCTKTATLQSEGLLELGRNVAMQVAAANPLALTSDDIDPAVVVREREVSRQKTLAEGKPENIVEKIVEGRIQKFYKEVCLVEQPYIRDDKVSIKALLAEQGKALDDTITIRRFVRAQLGEEV